MGPTAKSLILDLLSSARERAVPVRQLVEAAGLFGIAENALRVALARLRAAGTVVAPEPGAYRLGARARAVQEQVASWRRIEQRVRPWDGAWLAVHTAGLSAADRPAARRRERALRFLGLRTLAPGLEVRPDNLTGGVDAARERLRDLGLEREAPVFRIADLDAQTERRALALWDARAIVAGYREMTARLEESAVRLADLPNARARVESFLLGGEGIRRLVLDPLLPDPIVGAGERRALLESMLRYDRLGRAAWAGWLGDGARAPEASPADVRALDARGVPAGAAQGGLP